MKRVITAEWLDSLPATDPEARRSRADLRRINAYMGHLGIFCRLLDTAFAGSPIERVVDLGAGDGTFCLSLVRQHRGARRIAEAILVDRMPSVSGEARECFEAMGCKMQVVQADVFEWLEAAPPATVMFANLFLHHFREDEIAALFRRATERYSVFIAVEPRRSRLGLLCSHLLGFIGCNNVTRHDAVASVHAGFSGDELSRLWPGGDGWRIEEGGARLFSHSLLARRTVPASGGPGQLSS